MIAALVLAASALAQPRAIIRDLTHQSRVFGEPRAFRVFLPPDYDAQPAKRYPVVYWFHGWGEHHNLYTAEVRNYDFGDDWHGDNISAFVGSHDLIVVKWDGWNPRFPFENYLRPYNVGPVETGRQFPFYFRELAEYVDEHFRTIADREHRGVSGISMGGFMSFWIAGKYPDFVGSASSYMGAPEYFSGPRGFPAEYRHTDMYANYDGVRTRLIMGTDDFLRWFHRRMNAVWDFVRPNYEHETFVSEHGTPGIARTLEFHMDAFRNPLPRPVRWSHIDVYPDFDVWGWSVTSDRRRPGLTVLENVSRDGFRSSVREWAPAGALMPDVKLRIRTAPLYEPGAEYFVNGSPQRAGADGRLTIEIDGALHDIGISKMAGQALSPAGFRIEGAPWGISRKPFRLVLSILNKGAATSGPTTVALRSDANVSLDPPSAAVAALQPGARADIATEVTVYDDVRDMLKVRVDDVPVYVPIFRDAPPLESFVILDGARATVWTRGRQQQPRTIGSGNGNGIAEAGERVALGVPDGGGLRLLELFTNDDCVDNTARVTDIWPDLSGLMAHYNLPLLKRACEVPFFARWVLPTPPEFTLKEAVVRLRIR